MTDSLLGVFKICFLILLYLFFVRVLWAVWSEVRSPKVVAGSSNARDSYVPEHFDPRDATVAEPRVGTHPGGGVHTDATGADGRGPASGAPRSAPLPLPKPVRGRGGAVGRLVVLEPRAKKGTAYGVSDELTVGRGSGCTLSITDDTFISTLHARFVRHGEQLLIEDLGSTNGTYHNGLRLTGSAVVEKGDRIQIGNTVLEAG